MRKQIYEKPQSAVRMDNEYEEWFYRNLGTIQGGPIIASS